MHPDCLHLIDISSHHISHYYPSFTFRFQRPNQSTQVFVLQLYSFEPLSIKRLIPLALTVSNKAPRRRVKGLKSQ
ncbi:hypothetical protein I7I50_07864 [Histoplasma capsulatum G186AR]|uniref:Uncharacterized protein n=1 Tax=Ajellomyces capsulatus TaxID=5037 RepID=A0A8H7YJW1_AJECA|nr:hypothetical protein I7I52_08380 [Histoplasma capsulatum]QSS68450.1 hypothetical protein I7I50_07864 [Histoplasma capsulatum G186AR]